MGWLEEDKRERGEGEREDLDYLTHLLSTGAGEDGFWHQAHANARMLAMGRGPGTAIT